MCVLQRKRGIKRNKEREGGKRRSKRVKSKVNYC